MASCKVLLSIAIMASVAGVNASSASAPSCLGASACRRPTPTHRHPWTKANQNKNGIGSTSSSIDSNSRAAALNAPRGGAGIWGKSTEQREEKEQRSEESYEENAVATSAASGSNDDEEYEYEYYEADDDASAEEEGEEYADRGNIDETDVEHEWYEDEKRKVGKVLQDIIDGEFVDSDRADHDDEMTTVITEEDIVDNEEMGENDNVPDLEDGEIQRENNGSFWGTDKRDMNKEEGAADLDSQESKDEEHSGVQNTEAKPYSGLDDDFVEEGGDYTEDDEDEDYLFTTPIPTAKKMNYPTAQMNDVESPRKLQLVNRTVPKAVDMEDDEAVEDAGEGELEENEYEEDEQLDDAEGGDYEENDYLEEENVEEGTTEYNENTDDDYLYETPISNKVPVTRKARKASKSNNSRWWQQLTEKPQSWRPRSSSRGASFISPLFYSGAGGARPRSFSIRSSNGKPIYSEWMTSLSAALHAIVHPIGNIIQNITYSVSSTMSRWMAISWAVVRNSFDFMWHGPVDGVTTTGIATREGGLSAVLMSSPVAIAISSIVILALMKVLVTKLWRERARRSGDDGGYWGNLLKNRRRNRFDNGYDDEEDGYADDSVDPPSVEEELQFLNRDFDAANPSSKDRVTKAIAKQDRFSWPISRADWSRRGQRQFTIKSIQSWWKERPKQQSIAIIEPQHLRNQQQPPSHEIKRLHKQLAVSEQERAILQQDVQRLQHKLQKTHHDAHSILSQNKWLEKQTSKADQILAKAVEVERRKANEEMGKVRESMKGVLERERMMMRGRVAAGSSSEQRRVDRDHLDSVGGQNDLDLNKGPSTRLLDGVKIVREVDREVVDENNNGGGDTKKWTAM